MVEATASSQSREVGERAHDDTLLELLHDTAAPPYDINLFKREILNPEMLESFRALLEKRRPGWPR